MKKVLSAALLFFAVISLTGCGSSKTRQEAEAAVSDYNAAAEKANNTVESYNDAVDALAVQNEELEEAIQKARDAADSGGIPFDEQTLTSLNEEIQTAKRSEQALPDKLTEEYRELEQPTGRMDRSALEEQKEEAENLIDDLNANPVPEPFTVPDYSQEIDSLENAISAYEDSVAGYALVLSPSEDYVIERLNLIETITDTGVGPAEDKEDGMPEGYQSIVYFTDSRVDPFALYTREEDPDAVRTGVKGGGCVEIYGTEEKAKDRDDALKCYDGTIFGGGEHRVIGAMLIRVSDLLPTEEQLQLKEEITQALLLPSV